MVQALGHVQHLVGRSAECSGRFQRPLEHAPVWLVGADRFRSDHGVEDNAELLLRAGKRSTIHVGDDHQSVAALQPSQGFCGVGKRRPFAHRFGQCVGVFLADRQAELLADFVMHGAKHVRVEAKLRLLLLPCFADGKGFQQFVVLQREPVAPRPALQYSSNAQLPVDQGAVAIECQDTKS